MEPFRSVLTRFYDKAYALLSPYMGNTGVVEMGDGDVHVWAGRELGSSRATAEPQTSEGLWYLLANIRGLATGKWRAGSNPRETQRLAAALVAALEEADTYDR